MNPFLTIVILVDLAFAADFGYRFYDNGGCDHSSPAADTYPPTGQAALVGDIGTCNSAPIGVNWNRIELSSNIYKISAFCNVGCTSGDNAEVNLGTPCGVPYPGCAIGSFIATTYDFMYRFYSNGGCDHASPTTATNPPNNQQPLTGNLQTCYNAPTGTNWNRLEINIAGYDVYTFCNYNCAGNAGFNSGTSCTTPSVGCAVGSFIAVPAGTKPTGIPTISTKPVPSTTTSLNTTLPTTTLLSTTLSTISTQDISSIPGTPTTADSVSSSTSAAGSPSSKNSVPTGAIVGGVVGGLAVLAILTLFLFQKCRKRSDKAYEMAESSTNHGLNLSEETSAVAWRPAEDYVNDSSQVALNPPSTSPYTVASTIPFSEMAFRTHTTNPSASASASDPPSDQNPSPPTGPTTNDPSEPRNTSNQHPPLIATNPDPHPDQSTAIINPQQHPSEKSVREELKDREQELLALRSRQMLTDRYSTASISPSTAGNNADLEAQVEELTRELERLRAIMADGGAAAPPQYS